MRKYYHATEEKNLDSIIEKGILPGVDGGVYLTETPEDAYKFVAIRVFSIDPIPVLEVELDESLVEESFDHSQAFFKCRAFRYPGPIPVNQITATQYWGIL